MPGLNVSFTQMLLNRHVDRPYNAVEVNKYRFNETVAEIQHTSVQLGGNK